MAKRAEARGEQWNITDFTDFTDRVTEAIHGLPFEIAMTTMKDSGMPVRKCATKTRGRPFEAGNPGKPKGARHRVTVLAEKLMADDAEGVVRKVIEAAMAGDMTAARLILDRIAPPRRGRTVTIALPDVTGSGGVTAALAAVITAMGEGTLSPDEAAAAAAVIEVQRRAIETAEFEARLRAIEERIGTDEQSD
jgi:hypothetical protein